MNARPATDQAGSALANQCENREGNNRSATWRGHRCQQHSVLRSASASHIEDGLIVKSTFTHSVRRLPGGTDGRMLPFRPQVSVRPILWHTRETRPRRSAVIYLTKGANHEVTAVSTAAWIILLTGSG